MRFTWLMSLRLMEIFDDKVTHREKEKSTLCTEKQIIIGNDRRWFLLSFPIELKKHSVIPFSSVYLIELEGENRLFVTPLIFLQQLRRTSTSWLELRSKIAGWTVSNVNILNGSKRQFKQGVSTRSNNLSYFQWLSKVLPFDLAFVCTLRYFSRGSKSIFKQRETEKGNESISSNHTQE